MSEQMTVDLLEPLCARIERAWLDNGDRTLVYRLASEHPELRGELYEFFENLVLGPGERPEPGAVEAETRVHRWLTTSGFDMAKAEAEKARASRTTAGETSSGKPVRAAHDGPQEAPEPTRIGGAGGAAEGEGQGETWIAFLRQRIGRKLVELSAELPDVTSEYLVLVSRHPKVVPEGVKAEIAGRIQDRWGVPAAESLERLEASSPVLRAASRSRPFQNEPASFEELLERAALSDAQKGVWLKFRD